MKTYFLAGIFVVTGLFSSISFTNPPVVQCGIGMDENSLPANCILTPPPNEDGITALFPSSNQLPIKKKTQYKLTNVNTNKQSISGFVEYVSICPPNHKPFKTTTKTTAIPFELEQGGTRTFVLDTTVCKNAYSGVYMKNNGSLKIEAQFVD